MAVRAHDDGVSDELFSDGTETGRSVLVVGASVFRLALKGEEKGCEEDTAGIG